MPGKVPESAQLRSSQWRDLTVARLTSAGSHGLLDARRVSNLFRGTMAALSLASAGFAVHGTTPADRHIPWNWPDLDTISLLYRPTFGPPSLDEDLLTRSAVARDLHFSPLNPKP